MNCDFKLRLWITQEDALERQWPEDICALNFNFYCEWDLQTQTGHLPSLSSGLYQWNKGPREKWSWGPQCVTSLKSWEVIGYVPLSSSVRDDIISVACNWPWWNIYTIGVGKCCKSWLSQIPPAQCFSLLENQSVTSVLYIRVWKGGRHHFRSSQLHLRSF